MSKFLINGQTLINIDNIFSITKQHNNIVVKGSGDREITFAHSDDESAKTAFESIKKRLGDE